MAASAVVTLQEGVPSGGVGDGGGGGLSPTKGSRGRNWIHRLSLRKPLSGPLVLEDMSPSGSPCTSPSSPSSTYATSSSSSSLPSSPGADPLRPSSSSSIPVTPQAIHHVRRRAHTELPVRQEVAAGKEKLEDLLDFLSPSGSASTAGCTRSSPHTSPAKPSSSLSSSPSSNCPATTSATESSTSPGGTHGVPNQSFVGVKLTKEEERKKKRKERKKEKKREKAERKLQKSPDSHHQFGIESGSFSQSESQIPTTKRGSFLSLRRRKSTAVITASNNAFFIEGAVPVAAMHASSESRVYPSCSARPRSESRTSRREARMTWSPDMAAEMIASGQLRF